MLQLPLRIHATRQEDPNPSDARRRLHTRKRSITPPSFQCRHRAIRQGRRPLQVLLIIIATTSPTSTIRGA